MNLVGCWDTGRDVSWASDVRRTRTLPEDRGKTEVEEIACAKAGRCEQQMRAENHSLVNLKQKVQLCQDAERTRCVLQVCSLCLLLSQPFLPYLESSLPLSLSPLLTWELLEGGEDTVSGNSDPQCPNLADSLPSIQVC